MVTGERSVVETHETMMRQVFLYCYLAVPQPSVTHSQGDSQANPMLITAL